MKPRKKSDGSIKTGGERAAAICTHIILIMLSVLCAGAFLVVVGSSFDTQLSIQKFGYSFIPRQFSLEAYRTALANPRQMIDSYAVTFLSTVIGTVCGVWLCATCGYVMSRKNYKYRNLLSMFIFFTMLFNGGLVPNYILITRWLYVKNTIWALILPALISPWYIILMKGFFSGIPESLIESAKLDGAGELGIFAKIVIPVSKPVIATIGLFYVLAYWNSWFPALLYSENKKLYTLQFLLMNMLKSAEFLNSEEAARLGLGEGNAIPLLNVRMAMCVLAAGPILVVFPFFQKYFVKGITVGAVKG